MSDPDARDDLQRLRDQGLKPVRVLRVECEHNRVLAEVFTINGRLVMELRQTMTGTIEDRTIWVSRGKGLSVWNLEGRPDDATAEASTTTSCCNRTFTAGWLRHELTNGKRKTVLRNDDGRL